jgi:hypothetical protein
MHRSLRTRGLTILGAVAIVALAPAGIASAHNDARQGDLEMTIGFGTEPAFTGQPNSAQLVLVHDGKPVTNLKPGDVTVEVTYGDETSEPMTLEPAAGEPGDYRASFTPTQPGEYTFHFTGTVDGEDIDETMSSGPTTFAEVQDLATSEFPAVDAPSGDELATRIEQESARSERQLAVTQAEAVSAQDAASSARTVAIIGVALGALGVIAAIAALARKKG